MPPEPLRWTRTPNPLHRRPPPAIESETVPMYMCSPTSHQLLLFRPTISPRESNAFRSCCALANAHCSNAARRRRLRLLLARRGVPFGQVLVRRPRAQRRAPRAHRVARAEVGARVHSIRPSVCRALGLPLPQVLAVPPTRTRRSPRVWMRRSWKNPLAARCSLAVLLMVISCTFELINKLIQSNFELSYKLQKINKSLCLRGLFANDSFVCARRRSRGFSLSRRIAREGRCGAAASRHPSGVACAPAAGTRARRRCCWHASGRQRRASAVPLSRSARGARARLRSPTSTAAATGGQTRAVRTRDAHAAHCARRASSPRTRRRRCTRIYHIGVYTSIGLEFNLAFYSKASPIVIQISTH